MPPSRGGRAARPGRPRSRPPRRRSPARRARGSRGRRFHHGWRRGPCRTCGAPCYPQRAGRRPALRSATLSRVTARLLLIRHGEPPWNAEPRLQGQPDPPLSPLGREQAAALVPFLDGLPERVISSDLTRAVETAVALGLGGAPTDPRWREIDIGDWAGRTVDELHPGEVAAWRRGELAPPRAEPWADFQARVAAAVDALRGEDAVVVTHGGGAGAACAHRTGAAPRTLAPPA